MALGAVGEGLQVVSVTAGQGPDLGLSGPQFPPQPYQKGVGSSRDPPPPLGQRGCLRQGISGRADFPFLRQSSLPSGCQIPWPRGLEGPGDF